jgi:hypothetical protein
MSNTGAMKQLRGPKHENWPVCDPRAAPRLSCLGPAWGIYIDKYGLGSGDNGHLALARANGAIDGPYCSPTWPSVFGRRCELLAGRGGGFGGGAAPVPAPAARGALLQFECLGPRKTRGAQPGRPGLARKAWPGWLGYVRCSRPGGGRRRKAVAFHNPQALSNVQEEGLSCARDQGVITRPPVPC